MGGWKFLFTYPYWTAPWHNIARLGPAFGDWYQSGRETGKGIEPSGSLLRLLDILDEAQGATLPWTAEAQQRLERIPSFVRGVVVKRIEDYARRQGVPVVTAKLLQEVRRAMPVDFSKRLPFFLRDD